MQGAKNRNSERINGFNLVEVTIAMGVSILVFGGVMATLSLVTHGGKQFELVGARNEIINAIRVQSVNPNNLVKSSELTSNLGANGIPADYGPISTLGFPDLLKNCLPSIKNTPSLGCDKVNVDYPGKGILFYLTQNESLDPDKAVAGEDVYYRTNGQRCNSTDSASPSNCPLMARVWFEPNCLNFDSKCSKAISLIVRYQVGMRSDYKNDEIVTTLNGEFYVPLEKGIQIKNLLSQNDTPIYSNSKGIFTLPKYYGYSGQSVEGFRFEVLVSNPEGLSSMRLQIRTLTGIQAKDYDDSKIPDALLTQTWADLPTPGATGTSPWSIDLTGAGPNQTFNFGTQATVAANSRPPTAFPIGKSKGAAPDAKFHWTLNSDLSEYLPPEFKSGFYQFRVIATDIYGGEVESSNFTTVRLIGLPEFQYVNSSFNLVRDCVNSISPFSIFVGDDEDLTFSQIKLNGSELSTTPIVGTNGKLSFNFSLNQPAANYPIELTLKNRFSDKPLENLIVNKVEDIKTIVLSDVLVSSSLSNLPEKVRYLSTGTVSLNYSTGNCCNAAPTAKWSFPTAPDFGGVALLAENSTGSTADYSSTLSCSVVGNVRTCNSNITVRGLKESPNLSSPPYDIIASLDLGSGSTNSACQFSSSKPSGDPIGKFIPVINLPTIHFYISESLWIHNIPPGPTTTSTGFSSSIKPITPMVHVRMDFAPANQVEVYVVDSMNSTKQLCSTPLLFDADGSTTPIDKSCPINDLNFSGTIELRRKDNLEATMYNKIAYASETACPFAAGCDAQIAGVTKHNICQRNFTDPSKNTTSDFPMAPEYLVKADKDMLNSPYGKNSDGSQKVNNDYFVWKNGRKKQLRCYDNWNTNDTSPIPMKSTYNQQDYFDLYKYNNEDRLALSPVPLPYQFQLESQPGVYGFAFARFYFPINGGSYDYGADNVPYIYMVSQEGYPEKITWSSVDPATNLRTVSGKYSWEDVTSALNCNSLSGKIKLFRVRPNINWNTSTFIITDHMGIETYSSDYDDRYSYTFMCSYGRWHPSSTKYNNWTD